MIVGLTLINIPLTVSSVAWICYRNPRTRNKDVFPFSRFPFSPGFSQ